MFLEVKELHDHFESIFTCSISVCKTTPNHVSKCASTATVTKGKLVKEFGRDWKPTSVCCVHTSL